MTKARRIKASLGLLALGMLLGASPLQAGMKKDIKKNIENLKHALGWDTINLTTVDADEEGRATFERENNAANIVERRTSYQANGNKNTQSVMVLSKTSKKILFTEKKTWNDKGDLDSDYTQDDVFKKDGRQMQGLIVDRNFKDGRLVAEMTKRYSADAAEWGLPLKKTISYYPDGDMKERITENPVGGEKTRETWSEKQGTLGRKSTTTKWNIPKSIWE